MIFGAVAEDAPMDCDVAVVGLGGIGSAILAHCAARSAKVIGFEQFGSVHEFGSSIGKSRMIRKAYFEDPAYVPLLLRAYELWRELERATEEELLQITGLLMVGEERAQIVAGARRAASEHNLPLELLDRGEIHARYPALRVLPNEVGVFEPDGGVLRPEGALEAHLRVAARAGAQLRFGCAVSRWETDGDGFTLHLADGSRVTAGSLVLALGSWFQQTLASLNVPLAVQRNVQAWFSPATAAYSSACFPAFLIERPHFPAPLYGFPDFGDGVKAAFHAHGEFTSAADLDREIDRGRDIDPIAAAMEEWMPGATAIFRGAKVCPYSLTPDGHFVIDRHPQHPLSLSAAAFPGMVSSSLPSSAKSPRTSPSTEILDMT